MAEAILSDIAAGIISNLGSSALKEIGLLWDLKDELDKLERTVSTIESVLLDAEEKSIQNRQVKNWLRMLTEAMYDADDLLDEFSTEALRRQVTGGSKMSKKVRLFFSTSNQFAFGIKMGHKIKDVRGKLDEIAANRKFHLEERFVERVSIVAKGRRDQTHSSAPVVIVGRQVEKEAIVELLLSSDYEENVSIVSVFGMGGMGKTTLAVYSDDKVNGHFEIKMWVCVSDDFDLQLLVEKVLESASGEPPRNTQMDPLKNLLHKRINGRRYLLVLDDVWNEDVGKWSSLKDLLAGGARGSKIVITTRLRKVAEMSRPIYIHELRGLIEDEAWSLFKQMAFKTGQVLNPSHKAIGREIVAKCCGVPLAIRAIGGMMYAKDLESQWLLFKNEELSKIDVYMEDILPILKLSYNHLPSHYKHCFAYCSLYPKDYKIHVEELIHQWKAHGYLKLTDANECLQDVGFGCFMDLFRLSIFQDVEKDEFGNIKSCKMHDLATSVAGDNFSTSHSGMTSIKEKTHHMSFRMDQNFISPLLKAKKIRTVLPLRLDKFRSVHNHIKEEELDSMFCNCRCLRVLSLNCLDFNKLPSSIYKLKHLRYLDLSDNQDIKKIPDSINNLQNLQVLKLCWCSQLKQLPNNITKLVNLTDLDNSMCDGLTHMPRGIGKLTRLEKLSRFVIAKDNSISSKDRGGLDELEALNNLRGELEIRNLKFVKNAAFEFKAADLYAKKQLQKLTLIWDDSEDLSDTCSASDVANDEMALDALRPHQNLKGLLVLYYRGMRPPSWLPSLTNLMSVCFEKCRSIQSLPPFDQLPYLKSIKLHGLTNLGHIDVAGNFENGGSSSFFPSLAVLKLVDCPNLKGFVRCKTDVGTGPSSISMDKLPCFPCLSQLAIGGCPNLTYMPLFPGLRKLELRKSGIKRLTGVLKMTTTSASQSTSSAFCTLLSQLEYLTIWDMEDFLVDELLQYLPSLQDLGFFGCPCKSVSSDEKDDCMQWQNLKVLRSVIFCGMNNLVSLPKGLQYVTILQRLDIDRCVSLASIPEWMGNLVTLQDLSINHCPKLSGRCKNNTAEDWPKISHIPNISIDNESIQRNGCYLL